MRKIAGLLVVATLATQLPACGGAQRTTGGLLAGMGVAVAVGGLAAASKSNSEAMSAQWGDGNPNNDSLGIGDGIEGAFLLLAGLALIVVGGAIALSAPDEHQQPAELARGYLVMSRPMSTAAPGAIVTPAEVASLTDELPVMPTSPLVLQLAMQARNLAARGQCEGAKETVAAIGLHDVAYAHALVASPALAPCLTWR